MFNGIYLILIALFAKHWYIDFVNQSPKEVEGKGTYGNADGLMHSIKHGVATAIIMFWFVYEPLVAIFLGFIDFVCHYHIDWAKMNINKHYGYTIDKPAFWAWLGADQFAHQLTYIGLVWLVL